MYLKVNSGEHVLREIVEVIPSSPVTAALAPLRVTSAVRAAHVHVLQRRSQWAIPCRRRLADSLHASPPFRL